MVDSVPELKAEKESKPKGSFSASGHSFPTQTMIVKLLIYTRKTTLFLAASAILLLARNNNVVAAFSSPAISIKSQPAATSPSETTPVTFTYTHLEVNGMIWQVPEADVSLVIDPIASELNFGIPWGYRANKKILDERATLDAIVKANPTHCLLSQGLDDHTHLPTLAKLVTKLPNLKFLVAPSASEKVASLGIDSSRITVLEPGRSFSLAKDVTIQATQGALVGPPWQARENGWLLNISNDRSIYMEPHADVTDYALRGLRADVCILPVKEQSLGPSQLPNEGRFKLVYGGSRALEIAQILQASVVIPLGNGDLNTEGPLAGLVQATGGVDEFV